jgi:hypothetical protein
MNTRDRVRLAAETGLSVNAVSRWDLSKRTHEATKISLEKAALKLGILDRKCQAEDAAVNVGAEAAV